MYNIKFGSGIYNLCRQTKHHSLFLDFMTVLWHATSVVVFACIHWKQWYSMCMHKAMGNPKKNGTGIFHWYPGPQNRYRPHTLLPHFASSFPHFASSFRHFLTPQVSIFQNWIVTVLPSHYLSHTPPSQAGHLLHSRKNFSILCSIKSKSRVLSLRITNASVSRSPLNLCLPRLCISTGKRR
jgi:hypothetical protein